MRSVKPIIKSEFIIEKMYGIKSLNYKTVKNINKETDFKICGFVEPKKIQKKDVKKAHFREKRSKRNNAITSADKFVIYCPEERVKQYTEIVKNSNMSPVAVLANDITQKQDKLTFKDYAILLIVGLIIGFVNGFFGGGGGMLCVPLLLFCLKLKDKKAHATAILIMLPISIVSIIVYMSNFTIEFDTALFVTIGSVVGGILGSILLKKLSNVWIRGIFAVIMVVAGVKMIW